jgi:2-polyprenyl-3-methyl-5-hydroxy-6-metoxy-1,4-benzoquinol methylase
MVTWKGWDAVPGIGTEELGHVAGEAPMSEEYTLKESRWSSHGWVLSWLAGRTPRKVLDLGCSSGLLAAEVRRLGHVVTGVDAMAFPEAPARMDRFFQANLDEGIPEVVGGDYAVIIAGDVLEHVRHPDRILGEIRELLAPGGVALVSIPNFSHWYPRLRVLAGRFDYDDRGILDRDHVRFFTRRSFERLVRAAGLQIRRTETTGVPVERLTNSQSPMVTWASRLDRYAAMAYPSLFAYQYLFELSSARDHAAVHGE